MLAALGAGLLGPAVLPAGAATDVTAPSDLLITRDVVYGAAPDEHGVTETLRLDLYQPAPAGATRRPAVVWAHGGGFERGDKADPADAAAVAEFARNGYVSASINYRMRPDSFPE